MRMAAYGSFGKERSLSKSSSRFNGSQQRPKPVFLDLLGITLPLRANLARTCLLVPAVASSKFLKTVFSKAQTCITTYVTICNRVLQHSFWWKEDTNQRNSKEMRTTRRRTDPECRLRARDVWKGLKINNRIDSVVCIVFFDLFCFFSAKGI